MKVDEMDAMPIKCVCVVQDEATKEGSTSKTAKDESKKRKGRSRSQIDISDFPLGARSQPNDLATDDVSSQGPKLTWPQLLHLSPKMRRQWSKLVSKKE